MNALPSLKQLRYLIALSETGHFGKAAEMCFITQPSLSAAISDLEELLGAQLVERNKRQVLITPLGHDIVQRARSIITDVEELAALAHASSAPLTGPLRLGVIPTIGPYLLPDLMAELRSAFPDLQSDLTRVDLNFDRRSDGAMGYGFGLLWERLESDDWALDGVSYDTLPGMLALGLTAPGYDAVMVYAEVDYTF